MSKLNPEYALSLFSMNDIIPTCMDLAVYLCMVVGRYYIIIYNIFVLDVYGDWFTRPLRHFGGDFWKITLYRTLNTILLNYILYIWVINSNLIWKVKWIQRKPFLGSGKHSIEKKNTFYFVWDHLTRWLHVV